MHQILKLIGQDGKRIMRLACSAWRHVIDETCWRLVCGNLRNSEVHALPRLPLSAFRQIQRLELSFDFHCQNSVGELSSQDRQHIIDALTRLNLDGDFPEGGQQGRILSLIFSNLTIHASTVSACRWLMKAACYNSHLT